MLNIEYFKEEIENIISGYATPEEIEDDLAELVGKRVGHKITLRKEIFEWLLESHEDIELTTEEVEWLANMLSRYCKSNVTIERRYSEADDRYYLKVVIDKNISVFGIDKEEYKGLELFKEYTLQELKLERYFETDNDNI